VPSTRMLPSSVASFQYPRSFQTRRVNNSGDISWHKGRVFVSEVFRNEEIGLEQMDEDVHRVFFCNIELGEFNSSEPCASSMMFFDRTRGPLLCFARKANRVSLVVTE
jgi:hypothetical protein